MDVDAAERVREPVEIGDAELVVKGGREHDADVVGDGNAAAVREPGLEGARHELGPRGADDRPLGRGELDHEVGDHVEERMDLARRRDQGLEEVGVAEDKGGVVEGALDVAEPDGHPAPGPLEEDARIVEDASELAVRDLGPDEAADHFGPVADEGPDGREIVLPPDDLGAERRRDGDDAEGRAQGRNEVAAEPRLPVDLFELGGQELPRDRAGP